jgi:3-deoxy-D-manno-octulosonic-acid transferase
VLGSSKYDGLALRSRLRNPFAWRETLSLSEASPVVIGGSLRKDECTQILDAFEAVRRIDPKAVGIFAPRHMDRIGGMVQWLQSRSMGFHLLSSLEEGREKRSFPVVLVDRIGVLFELYGLGDLVFCGGTLEPIGGHNIVEPAAWKKAVFYGPHLQKVFYEHTILQKLDGSFLVRDVQDLIRQWSYWIEHLDELKHHGKKAGEALEKLGGVAPRQVELIRSALFQRTLQAPGNHAKA